VFFDKEKLLQEAEMKRVGKTVAGLFSFTILAAGGVAHAAVLSVDPTFVDPLATGQYRTIKDAVTAAQSGDTIQVAAGEYTDAVTITKGLSLQGSGPQYSYQKRTITVNTTEVVTISGFSIISGDGIVVTAPTTETNIVNNCIVSNSGVGIKLFNATTVAPIVNIINNTIAGNGAQGILCTVQSGAKYTTVQIVNNIFSNNASYGVNVGACSYTISRNVFFANGGTSASPDYFTATVNTSDNLFADPGFADLGQGDYTLVATSAVRNQGKMGVTYLNPDGTRNDIGAFGGPGAAAFWPYGYGPIVTAISASPARVTQGGSITINATAKIR
jgi:hypothetical protein